MTYNNTLNSKQLIQQRKFIIEEIAELTNRVKFHDTGHIKTTISTLKARKREIDRLLANDPDWYDEYLLGI
jgi:hypothetical protein